MTHDEETDAARAIGELLTSAMFRAYEENPHQRTFLYIWERQAFQWLIRYRERNPKGSVGNDWALSFIELNHDAILSENGTMDFNLKSFNERRGSI